DAWWHKRIDEILRLHPGLTEDDVTSVTEYGYNLAPGARIKKPPTPTASERQKTSPSLSRLRAPRPIDIEFDLQHVGQWRPYNAWAWLLMRLINGPYVPGKLLGHKQVRATARAMFSCLPPRTRHLRSAKAIKERVLLNLHRADGIQSLGALREILKRGHRARSLPF